MQSMQFNKHALHKEENRFFFPKMLVILDRDIKKL